jgi:hypothetical protein
MDEDGGFVDVAAGAMFFAFAVPLAVALKGAQLVGAMRARLRRWPMPASIGCLTNEDIDRL